MTTCEHCGAPIVAGDRMVIHEDQPATWIDGVLVSQPTSCTPYHERCFSEAASPS